MLIALHRRLSAAVYGQGPQSAAVNESVKLVKNNRAQFAARTWWNAMLRKVASNGLQLPDESDRLNFMSVKYSVPEQTVKLFVDAYSDRTACEIFRGNVRAREDICPCEHSKMHSGRAYRYIITAGVLRVRKSMASRTHLNW